MSQPRVSVLIPCFNAEAYIAETLESVFQQSWKNIEVIVVNDGSVDGSEKVISKFGKQVNLVSQENRGQTAALNTALAHANGDYVQYLDADDVIDPSKIERQIERLIQRPKCVATAKWGRFYNDPADTRFVEEAVQQDLAPIDWLALSRSEGQDMMFPALWLIPMETVRAVGPWREDLTLNNDAEYFTRVVLASEKVLYCDGAQCRYRSDVPGSLSSRTSPEHWRSKFEVLHLCEGYVRLREDTPRIRRGFALTWLRFAHVCHPYARDLAECALKRAAELDEVRLQPHGGVAFKLAARLVGWRTARKLQVLSGRP